MTAKKIEWPLGDAMRQTFEDELAARRITYDRDESGAYRLSCKNGSAASRPHSQSN